MSLQSDFLKEVEAFIKKHRMSPSGFSQRVMNDPSFVARMHKAPPLLRTIEKVRKFMNGYKGKSK